MRVTSPAVTIKAIWDALVADYGVAGSYGLLLETNLDGKVSLAKADLSTLETRLTAARAAKLDNLDNIDSSLKELFYEAFKAEVDDFPGVVATGTATNPENLIDNDTATVATMLAVDIYVEVDLKAPCYVKEVRHYGSATINGDGRFKVQAFVEGAWIDVKTDIPQRAASWSSWIALTTPSMARLWRWTVTTVDTGADKNRTGKLELRGVRIGG